ncbi:cytochrome P450 CYP82D47-like isoform X2 [Mercurialis annua]|uniref:cytochrome P450 CYP82D47-like isoform X2 n=1 Tax=Mercurialis annua TaxID=3986 RepID=UPI00215F922B|nr:cytochrome P450 CYP82D47-like isoform X2 [Mercurialis annua]
MKISLKHKRWSKSAKTKAAPEAGGAWPIIGHLPLLAGRELPHIALAALVDEYGPIFTIRIGIFPALVVNSWELAKELFTINDAVVSTRPKFTSAKLLGHNFVNFGFAPYGEFWREMRKVVASELLSNRRLELLKGIRADEVEGSIKDLFKFWEKSKDGNNQALIEMKKWFNDINMNVILRMVAGKRYFGISAAGDEEEAHRFQKAAREFFHLAGVYVLRDAFPLLGWMDFGGYEKAMKKTAKEFDTIIGGWLEEHRRKRDISEVGDKDKDFIDVLMLVLDGINLSGYDPDTVRKATTVTLIAGGTDTTTVSVTWALVLLLNHPVALRKAQEELDIQVGKERLVNESDMNKLVYLQAIIKETLRLYPVGSLLAREFTEDCTVSSYHIPAGTRLLVNLHTIHRDPRVWSNPTKFEPERFLSAHKEIDVKGQNFELIPFGGGRRICPGMNFGIVMTQLLLASFLQAFDISTPSNEAVDMRATPGLTNSKATPLQVMFKPRLPAYLYERS